MKFLSGFSLSSLLSLKQCLAGGILLLGSLSVFDLHAAVLEKPWIPSLNEGEKFTECLVSEIQRQSPRDIVGDGDVYFAGPLVRVDYTPKGSAIEMIANVPNAKPYPRLLTLSLVFEGVERNVWEEIVNAQGQSGYTNVAMVNPILVFDRTQMKYLFELDVSSCVLRTLRSFQ